MFLTLGLGERDYSVLKPAGFRQSVYSLLLATLAINILSLALPVMTLQVYDRILPNPGTGTLPVLIAGVCLAILLEAVLRLCRAYVIGRAGAAYEHRMGCAAMEKTLNADLSRMGSHGIGEHLNRIGSIGKLKDFYDGYSLTVLLELAFVPLFFALILYIANALAWVPAAILTVFIFVSLWKGHRMKAALQSRDVADEQRFNFLIEALEGVHTVKAFALEKFFERRYEALEEKSTFGNFRVTQETADIFNIGAIFSHIMVAAVITSGAWFVLHGMLTTGALIATLLLAGRMMQPVQKTLALWARYQDFLIARQYVYELFTAPQRKIITSHNISHAASVGGRILASKVFFKFEGTDNYILRNINLDIRRGEAVHISGPHGSGKTTFLNVLSGLYPPAEGAVKIDGRVIDAFVARDLVRHVGYVRTQPLIFRGTIRDNITSFGQTDEAQAREVAALLEVDRDVAKLPGGFDTLLSGTNTDNIPQDLKQRISIARVLAAKPGLIFFDNADRCVDKRGYTLIYSLLARLKGRVSMIIVSDDRNMAALADRHYQLENGCLVKLDYQTSRGNVRPYKELPL